MKPVCWNFPIKNISICKILRKKIISGRFLFKSAPKKMAAKNKTIKIVNCCFSLLFKVLKTKRYMK
ncbi:hypothetical protein C9371_02125 [Campylobacter jejuni]|nr:hypothetical protein C9371_02125 [Campylobacter jejuni]